VEARKPAQEIVVGVEILSPLAFRALDLRLRKPWSNLTDHLRRDLILKVEDVPERAVEAISPKVRSGGRVDHLRGDAHAVPRFSHTTLENVARAEVAADLL